MCFYAPNAYWQTNTLLSFSSCYSAILPSFHNYEQSFLHPALFWFSLSFRTSIHSFIFHCRFQNCLFLFSTGRVSFSSFFSPRSHSELIIFWLYATISEIITNSFCDVAPDHDVKTEQTKGQTRCLITLYSHTVCLHTAAPSSVPPPLRNHRSLQMMYAFALISRVV